MEGTGGDMEFIFPSDAMGPISQSSLETALG